MPILVDGNNLLHQLPPARRSRAELRRLCLELVRREGLRVTVVFDGAPPAGTPATERLGRVTILYAAPRSADDEIVRRVREARDPRGVTVVTDDHLLAESAAAAGARTMKVSDFARGASTKLAAPTPAEERPEPPPNVSVRDWERWFSDPKNKLK